ncbi:dihydrofolate reductase family protein [Micromonospora sp. NPDC049274]|uniref:dihydrofolate reductase family protein n=1 Tax=Micromonospora sp. NPDC049274 TaxID=3154829 RepID=UPI00341DD079
MFVLTHQPPAEPSAGITFVGDPHSAVEQAKKAAGDRYVNVLGADIARQCVRAGLLDEILIFVAPVLLGDGVRMFDDRAGRGCGSRPSPARPRTGTASVEQVLEIHPALNTVADVLSSSWRR